MDLQEILGLVGTLDDAGGEESARERFRKYLSRSVTTIGAVRDYVGTCLRNAGPEYARALQDLVNHTARLVGFDVEFGRYAGVQGHIGHDGLWRFKDFCIVAEVKTTDAYAIKTATLAGYIDHLISDHKISDWDHALGLYIVGRPDAALKQLENSITAEKRTHQMRVATVENILMLAELVQDNHITADEGLSLLRPAGVLVDEVLQLLARVASPTTLPAERAAPVPILQNVMAPPGKDEIEQPGAVQPELPFYMMTPVADDEDGTAEDAIRTLLESGWYVFGEKAPNRKRLKAGDHICFYQSGLGVVAEAEVVNSPERKVIKHVRHPEKYPWAFEVKNARFFFDTPIVIDASLRAKLHAFKDGDPNSAWGWFVVTNRPLDEHDFLLLTGAALP
jgi:hypothetical protein